MISEEERLFDDYHFAPTEALLNTICEHYLPLARKIAKHFCNRGVEYDDLFQVASLALVKAVRRFNSEKGVKFSTFATPTIVGEVKNYFRDKSRLISLPRRSGVIMSSIESAREKLTHQLMRSPTADELAAETGLSVETILEILEMRNSLTPVSLDAPVTAEEEDLSLQSILGIEEIGYQSIEIQDTVKRLLATLDLSERTVLIQRYLNGKSQQKTAEEIGVSQMTVSRIEKRALQKAKQLIGDQ